MATEVIPIKTAGLTLLAQFTQISDGYIWDDDAANDWVVETSLTTAQQNAAATTLAPRANGDSADIGYKLTIPAGIVVPCRVAVYQDAVVGNDPMYEGDYLPEVSADAVKISGSSDAADKLEASAETMQIGAAEAGTLSTTQMTSDLTEATDNHYNGRVIIWTSGVLLRQATDITDYSGATGLLTFTAVTEVPTAGDTFIIV